MPTSVTEAQVRDIVSAMLGEPGVRARFGLGGFGAAEKDMLATASDQLAQLMSDRSLQGAVGNSAWMDGVSIINGTITAPKITVSTLEAITISTGALNVTTSITAATAFPATGARVVINSTGLLGYNSTPTNTFKFGTDGSGFVGVGGTAITWSTIGAVTIPVAAIGSLTIAAVGGGVLGGTYETATGTGARLEFDTTSFRAYNSSNVETFALTAATGAMTATGSFTIKSASSGAHVTISNAGGIVGYNATSEVSGNETFRLNAATGAGFVGLSPGTVVWDSAGAVTINGSVLVTGTVTANKISGGTLNGSFDMGSSDITVNSTGKLYFGSGADDYLGSNLLHFEVTSSETAKIEFKNGANTPYGSVNGLASSTRAFVSLASSVSATNNGWVAVDGSSTTSAMSTWLHSQAAASRSVDIFVDSDSTLTDCAISFDIDGRILQLVNANRAASFYGRIYPGTGSATQTTGYIYWDGTQVNVTGSHFKIAGGNRLICDQVQILDSFTSGSGALPNPTKALTFKDSGGTTWYVPAFSAFNAWAA